MSSLVIKKWTVNRDPDKDGQHIIISGREGGLLAWLLTLVGIDPTTSIRVSGKRIEFRAASLSGTNNKIIPLQGICSTYYGYYKPWKSALAIFLILPSIFIGSGGFFRMFFAWLIGAAVAAVYYYLNRTLTLGFIELSGVSSGINFKRSIIENIDINEEQARNACELTQELIEKPIPQ